MTPETLHDAITLLPEDLLIPTDRLRQKKRIPWRSAAALAACLCLVVGLCFWNPGAKNAMDTANGAGATPECEPMENAQHSTADAGVMVTVVAADKDHLLVTDPQPDIIYGADISIQPLSTRLTFENLQQIPSVQEGQTIRIYFKPEQFDKNKMVIKPYKIEIIEEDTQ